MDQSWGGTQLVDYTLVSSFHHICMVGKLLFDSIRPVDYLHNIYELY